MFVESKRKIRSDRTRSHWIRSEIFYKRIVGTRIRLRFSQIVCHRLTSWLTQLHLQTKRRLLLGFQISCTGSSPIDWLLRLGEPHDRYWEPGLVDTGLVVH